MNKKNILKLLPAVVAALLSVCASAQSASEIAAAKSMARSYGYSDNEINAVLNHNIGGGTSAIQTPSAAAAPTAEAAPATEVTVIEAAERPVVDRTDDIYGHSYLTSSGLSIIPSYNAPVPAAYVLGPGDELMIDIWGATVSHVAATIGNDGSISVSDLGPVYLSGITLSKAEEFLREQLGRIYSGLSGSSPDTFLRLSIGKIKGVSINVSGEVATPGLYSIPSLATIPSVIYMAGGVKDNGSVRKMTLYRHGRKIADFDLYDFLFKGKFNENLRLQDGDVINVAAYSSVVSVAGAVKRPMRYEIVEGETIKDLIGYADGFTLEAQRTAVNVYRRGISGNTSIDVPEADFASFKLCDGDRVSVRTYNSQDQNTVSILGPVKYPGAYSLGNGITDLVSLLKAAGGLVEGAYTGKGQVSRRDENRQPEFFTFDLARVLEGGMKIKLQREDIVTLYSHDDMSTERFVSIDGAVVTPGVYSYRDSLSLQQLIRDAGGLAPDAYVASGQIIREGADGHPVISPFDVEKVTDGILRLELQPGDAVRIYSVNELRKNATVTVTGEVNAPGEVVYRDGMTLEELVSLAQGNTHGVDLSNVEISRRGGRERGSVRMLNIEEDADLWKTELKAFDVVTFRRLTYFRNQITITVNGEVVSPGPYAFDEAEVRLSDVMARVGGFTDAAYVHGANLTRVLTEEEIERQRVAVMIANQNLNGKDSIDIGMLSDRYHIGIDLEEAMSNPKSVADVTLRDGDIIDIPIMNNTVKISGGVFYPNTVAFDRNLKWKDYVHQAGGFTKLARKKKTYAVYMNGKVAVGRNIYIEPGMELIVPERKESENQKMSPVEIASLASSTTSIATMVLSLIRLFK